MPFKSSLFRRVDKDNNDDSRERRIRQRLVVHTKAGRTLLGFSFSLNRNADSFHLDLVDRNNQALGKSVHVPFSDVKAIYTVKSFDGRFDPTQFDHTIPEDSPRMVVEFIDGELLVGYPASPYKNDEPRFVFIPEDRNGNNLSVLVERSAVAQMLTPEEHKHKLQRDFEEFLSTRSGRTDLSREELLGDYHFHKKNYFKALKHYQTVREQEGENSRLRKKLCAAKYNVAICHIRQKDYEKALRYFEMVLALDSGHDPARKGMAQVLEHLNSRKKKQSDT